MKPSFRQSGQFKLLVFLILVASVLRVFLCFHHNPMDSRYLFSDMGRHWLDGTIFPRAGYGGAGDPILYQVYIGALSRIAHGHAWPVALASALLSILTPWTYYRAARNFGLRKLPALWVWALIAWTPSLLAIFHYILMETLLLFLEGLALWMTARYLRKGGTEAFLVSVFAWTLACLTKPSVVPLAGVCLLWSWWKKSPKLRDVAIAAALVFVLLVPQAIRSKVVLGFFAPLGNDWFTKIQHRSGARSIHLYLHTRANPFFHSHESSSEMIASSPSVDIRPLWPVSDWAMTRAYQKSNITLRIDSAHGSQDWRTAYSTLNVGWEEWLTQWRENVVLFLFSPSWPEWSVSEWDDKLEFGARWMWAPLIFFVLVFNFRAFLRRQFELLPVAVTLFTLFLALQNVVTFEGRYRKPLEPLLLLNLVWILAGMRTNLPEKGEIIAELPPQHAAQGDVPTTAIQG